MKIYIAGPMTRGDISKNIVTGITYGDMIANKGHTVFIPHLTFFWDMFFHNHDYEFWMKQDFEWIKACDAIFRIVGESPGADREIELAKELGKTIFYSVFDIPDISGEA